jgi:ABC-type transport system involved in cytochrome c biogenesis permease subunit
MCDPNLLKPEHKEAVQLAWESLHIPVGSILVGALLLSGVISAVSSVWGYGPANPIP